MQFGSLAFLNESGKSTYSITASWIISGLVLKQRKDSGLSIAK